MNAAKTGEIAYGFQITPDELPPTYTPGGQNVFANGTKNVPANTVMDVNRYQQDLAALAPGHQLSLLSLNAMDRRFGDGYLQTWTLGAERAFGGLTADAAYVGTESFRLPRVSLSECLSWSRGWLRALYEFRQQRRYHRRLRLRVCDHRYSALFL